MSAAQPWGALSLLSGRYTVPDVGHILAAIGDCFSQLSHKGDPGWHQASDSNRVGLLPNHLFGSSFPRRWHATASLSLPESRTLVC